MGNLVFNSLVWMGRLFMASLFLLIVIIAIPFAGVFELLDRHARDRAKRATQEFID